MLGGIGQRKELMSGRLIGVDVGGTKIAVAVLDGATCAALAEAHDDEGALVAQHLGVGIANAINTFDPDLVVVGHEAVTERERLPATGAAAR
jgi:predicted NBD/HSP70 family sugar kinase